MTHLTRRAPWFGVVALGIALAGAGRMAIESRQEATGARPSTWATTRILDPSPVRGALAARMTQVTGAPPTGARRLVAIAWAAPTTAVGLLLGAAAVGTWRWHDDLGAIVVTGARNPLLRIGGFAGQGVGHVIVSSRRPVPPRLLVHEAAHVRQAEILGPLTLPLYFWWLARDGYRHHPMERGARATARAWVAKTRLAPADGGE